MRIENNPAGEAPASVPLKEKKEKKKKRRWIKWLIILAIIIGLPVAVIGATGVYNIPVVSQIFGTNKPIDLGIKASPEALASALAGNPVTIKGDPAEYSGVRNKKYSGKVDVDVTYTSEEVTSFLQHFLQNAPHIRDLQVKYIEGGLELSTFVKTYIKAPVYAKVYVTRTSNKSVDINLEKVKVGRIPVPERYYSQIEEIAEKAVNNQMNEIEAFTIDTLEFHDGYAVRKGTLPKTVELLPGEKQLDEFL
ncbi:MAG: hypothetical protein COY66_06555 [Candidatus Kerfeldbacteria bacterium CG_4_10_14_0_8_um_filter_42_10]|uniref:Uncharacterized protein n=1 Tax=Candidatus Kerfeldbacteria bacterium CG_4_10_14_0_8_um_filter_42_10 TaxID=2014248 RepID=A0A2M7RFX8_9BACT|nr:MAG: hypothetical protein COY66_06555 [Candidatus Kerfeldbacteria bacterium CG_4_10_14_0_8_um_filter_42_10]